MAHDVVLQRGDDREPCEELNVPVAARDLLGRCLEQAPRCGRISSDRPQTTASAA